MTDFFEVMRQVLVPMFCKETQLGRSLRSNKLAFNKQLLNSIMELANKADDLTLRNEDIRARIRQISKDNEVSIGQAQKVINVYLKYYCILRQKPEEVLKELDCPLDSQIMTKFKTKGVRRTSLKNMTEFSNYVAWQEHLEREGNGIRLKPDIETYDMGRINSFLGKDTK